MRIDLVTDIHDDVPRLKAALAMLRKEKADSLISLGDTTDFHGPHNRVWEVAKLLRDAGAVGVWGNHDFGLCRDLPLDNPEPDALAYMAKWQPTFTLARCHFSQVEPWLDANDPAALWYFDGPPDTPAKLARSFMATRQHAMFMGHFHRWQAYTPDGIVGLPWRGEQPLYLDVNTRYLVVVGLLFAGHFAVYDTDMHLLHPHFVPDIR